MEIKTQEDWWESLNENWNNILDIFVNCGAPLTETVFSDGIGKEAEIHDKTLLRTLEDLRTEKNGLELSRWLNLCWIAAPDKPYIHSWPSWSAMCDLCSENWVFDEKEAA